MRVSRPLVLLSAALLAAGCDAAPKAAPAALAPTPARPAVSVPASVTPPNGVDFLFAEMMVAHHAQAVTLSRSLLAKPDVVVRVRDVAAFIAQDQQREADQMTAWLQAWGRGTPGPAAAAGHEGHGMLTAAQLASVETAPDPGRLFLQLMIAHHEGAITMARSALKDGRNTFVHGLAKHIVNEQSAENDTMRELLRG